MPGPESVRGYLDAVEAQIRWKRARTVAARELETHLEDQQEEFLAEGHPPEEAERLAVEDMGDPVAVGADLDRLHRPRPQWGMLGLTLALLLRGPLGITAEEMPTVVAIFCSPVAVTSAVMVQEMGGDEQLAQQVVAWSSALSMVTIFCFAAGLRAMGVM